MANHSGLRNARELLGTSAEREDNPLTTATARLRIPSVKLFITLAEVQKHLVRGPLYSTQLLSQLRNA